MRKSPFSTPRGNGGRPGFGWNSGGSPGRGYRRPNSQEFYSPNRSQTSQSFSGSEDFIPLDSTPSPNQNRKSNDSWQSPRGQWQGSPRGGRTPRRQSASPGYNNFRDNHRQQPPYFKDGGRPFHGQRNNFQRGNPRRKPDISQYMNLRSFLEDPWSEFSIKSNNIAQAEESLNDSSSDLSFSNAVLGESYLDDSINDRSDIATNLRSKEVANDSFLESDNSFIQTSQEFADISGCSENSQDPKLSQDSND